MSTRTILSGLCAIFIPLVCYTLTTNEKNKHKRQIQICILVAYVLGILFLTLLRAAEPGRRQINLTPFWSYALVSDPQYRWQIYMNVFLFIPFGFMLPWAANRAAIQTILIGFLLSTMIELSQYVFSLGMCEFDDVFHNTLGSAIGYLYWHALDKHAQKALKFIQRAIKNCKK